MKKDTPAQRLVQHVSRNKKPWIIGSSVAAFAILGVILMTISNAATSVVAIEAEAGTRSGNTSAGAAGGASGGASVRFGSAGSTPNPTPPGPGGNYKPGFVYRNGRTMMLDGKVYKAPGVNNFALTGCHHGYSPSQTEMDSYFSKMKAGTMVRTWAFNHSNETLIDRTVATADKYNVKLILTLADGAEYCGSPDYDGGWYSSGFKGAYFSWISKIVGKHKGSKAVGAWEIMNEPALKADVSASVMNSFFDQTAAHIKSIDPDHLVSTGTLAPWQGDFGAGEGDCMQCYVNMHDGPNIDIVSLHEYDYAQNAEIISNHYDDTKQAADIVNKPVIIGETGVTKKSGCMTSAERASVYKQKMDAYFNAGASGVFFWGITWPPNEGTVCNEEHGSNDPVDGDVQRMVNGYTVPN